MTYEQNDESKALLLFSLVHSILLVEVYLGIWTVFTANIYMETVRKVIG